MQMKKLMKSTLALASLASLLLVGCGKASKTENNDSAQASADANSGEAVAAQEQPAEETSSGEYAEAFANGDIENNGSSFVRVGDKVYYKVMGPKGVDSETLGGYLQEQSDESTKIKSYDLKTGAVEDVATVNGVDNLFATPNGIVVSSPDYNSSLLCPVDGSEVKQYLNEGVIGVSDDGRTLVTHKYDDENNGYDTIYRDDKVIDTINDSEDFYHSIQVSGNDVFVLKIFYDSTIEKPSLTSYNTSGECTDYGVVDLTADDEYLNGAFGLSQVLRDDNDAYLLFDYYQGSGGFYAGYEIHKVTIGVENSLESYESAIPDNSQNLEEGVLDKSIPRMYLDSNNKAAVTFGKTNDISDLFSEDDSSDLVYYDESGNKTTIKESYFSRTDSNTQFLSASAVFGDDAFLIVSDSVRDSSADIGWRDGYSIKDIRFVHINKNDGKEDVLDTVEL